MVMSSQPTSDVTGDHALALAPSKSLVRSLTFERLRRVVGRWIERSRQRRALMWLDDLALADIGITRAEAAREAARPFWR